jgi:argininosuccinate synthase
VFDTLSRLAAKQIYQGYGYDTATQMIERGIDRAAELATGTITVSLHRGMVHFHAASDVPHSLYSEANASMEAIGEFDHADSEGFLRVLSVSARALAAARQIEGE